MGAPREIEKFVIRQPIGEKDDYDSENSWISDDYDSEDGLPSSSRRRRRGVGRWEVAPSA